jgi:hypothetical protein
MIQPPTFDDEHRSTTFPRHENSNAFIVFAFGLMPRSIHMSPQPRTQVIVVDPAGASTTSSKFGSDTCAFAAAHPVPSNAAAMSVLAIVVIGILLFVFRLTIVG